MVCHSFFSSVKKDFTIQQKTFVFLDTNGDCGITKANLSTSSLEYITSEFLIIQNKKASIYSIIDVILNDYKSPLEIHFFVDNFSFIKLTDELYNRDEALLDEQILTHFEDTSNVSFNIQQRLIEMKNYVNLDPNSYICLDCLKDKIELSLDLKPLPADAVSFLLSIEQSLSSSLQDVVNVYANASKYIEPLPFQNITLDEVLKGFNSRYERY